jgi:hypothetical protein
MLVLWPSLTSPPSGVALVSEAAMRISSLPCDLLPTHIHIRSTHEHLYNNQHVDICGPHTALYQLTYGNVLRSLCGCVGVCRHMSGLQVVLEGALQFAV